MKRPKRLDREYFTRPELVLVWGLFLVSLISSSLSFANGIRAGA